MSSAPGLANKGAVVLGLQSTQANFAILVFHHQDRSMAIGCNKHGGVPWQVALEAALAWEIQSSGSIHNQIGISE
jgi:hypothetical protein